MLNHIPQSRSRLYTSPGLYARIFWDVITSRYTKGDDVEKFEQEIARRAGAKYAIAMPMARTGIYYTVKALIKPGQDVIMSPYTIADVVNMVICAGGKPVFADIKQGTCNIDEQKIEKLITKKTGLVMVTHFYGLVCETKKIQKLCAKHKIPMIEDAAQAFSAVKDGQHTGSFGTAGIFSFGMYKNINSIYGGAVVTNDKKLHDKIRQLATGHKYENLINFGKRLAKTIITDILTWTPVFKLFTWHLFRYGRLNDVDAINNKVAIDTNPQRKNIIPASYEAQYTPMQARLVLSQLNNLPAHNAERLAKAKIYHAGLKNIKGLILPPLKTDGSHLYMYFPIQTKNRMDLVKHLVRNNCDIMPSYHRNCADMECFTEFHRKCPQATATEQGLIYLPTYPGYSIEQVQKNIQTIQKFFSKKNTSQDLEPCALAS